MQKNNPIVDNWINTNTTKLLEIRNENVELYDTVISTLAYLNNYLGSENKEALINIPEPKFKVGDLVNRNTPTIRYEVLSYSYNPTSKEYFYNLSRLSDRHTILEKEINLIEAEEIPHQSILETAPELAKFKVGDFVVYEDYNLTLKITKLDSGNGQIESVLADGSNPRDIIYLMPDKTKLLDEQPKYKVGDRMIFPKTQFGLGLDNSAKALIEEATAFGYQLVVLDVTYGRYNSTDFDYWLGFEDNSATAKVPFEEDDLILFEEAPTLKNFKIQTFNNEETSKLFDYLVDNNLIKTYRTSQNAVFSNELIDSIKNNSSVISERYFVITEDSELISPSETIFEQFEMPQYTLQELGINKPYIDYVDRSLDSTKFQAQNFNEAKEIIELLTTYRYNGKTIKFANSPNIYTRHKYFAIDKDFYLESLTETEFNKLRYAELDLINFLNVAPNEQIEVVKTPKKRVAKQKNIIPLQENKQKPAEQIQSKPEQSDFDDLLDELDNLEF